MSRTRASLTAAVLLSTLALGGCSDDADPRPDPPVSSGVPMSPSTSATGASAEPTMPVEAQGTDAAAAEAFVKFYWEMVNYAQASGDVDGLEAIADQRCAACKAGVAFLKRVEQKDGRISGGVGTVVIKQSGFVGRDVAVRFTLKSTRQTVDYPGNSDDESYPGGTTTINATVTAVDDGWRLRSWSVEK